MADPEEMRSLIHFAAERLGRELAALGEHGQATRNTIAGMALAEATLRMVAACMGVEEESVATRVTRPTVNLEPPAGPRRTRRPEVTS